MVYQKLLQSNSINKIASINYNHSVTRIHYLLSQEFKTIMPHRTQNRTIQEKGHNSHMTVKLGCSSSHELHKNGHRSGNRRAASYPSGQLPKQLSPVFQRSLKDYQIIHNSLLYLFQSWHLPPSWLEAQCPPAGQIAEGQPLFLSPLKPLKTGGAILMMVHQALACVGAKILITQEFVQHKHQKEAQIPSQGIH